jgi:SAM-dependent methyltransferase
MVMLDSRIRSLAQKLLPRFLLIRLDPIGETIDREVRDAAASMSGGMVALDAGAGEGRHGKYFLPGTYIALDRGTGDPAWDYSQLDVIGDLEDLPLLDQSVERILCNVVLEHTRDPGGVIAEFGRVLKDGGRLHLVVPFLWEEHQVPRDYFRFTRHGVQLLFEGLPFHLDVLEPMGGIFRLCARRCVNLLEYFQGGWRWLLFLPLAPILGFLLPLLLHCLDGMDSKKHFTLGFRIRATKEPR